MDLQAAAAALQERILRCSGAAQQLARALDEAGFAAESQAIGGAAAQLDRASWQAAEVRRHLLMVRGKTA